MLRHDLLAKTTCDHCSKQMLECNALQVTKQTRGAEVTFNFCGETCANEFYLEKLRSSEGSIDTAMDVVIT